MNENLLVHTNDKEYKKFLVELKEKVKNSQLKAAIKVNYELLNLYWELGKKITEKQKEYSWGDSFISNLSNDLKKEFPDIKKYLWKEMFWSRSFCLLTTGGATIDVIKKYIEEQGQRKK